MKILCISDTHAQHKLLPSYRYKDVDMIIHAGDAANYKDKFINHNEMIDFIDWYASLPVKYKIFVAGNHDVSVFHKAITKREFETNGIIYLENDYEVIEGIKIYGSPITPKYNDWAFMCDRHKTQNYWDQIPDDTDILVTHGPPRNILDAVYEKGEFYRHVGCKSLANTVYKIAPKYHIFGHIHDQSNVQNNGILIRNNITYVNASCVTDRKFNKGLTSHGTIIEL